MNFNETNKGSNKTSLLLACSTRLTGISLSSSSKSFLCFSPALYTYSSNKLLDVSFMSKAIFVLLPRRSIVLQYKYCSSCKNISFSVPSIHSWTRRVDVNGSSAVQKSCITVDLNLLQVTVTMGVGSERART